MADGFRTWSLAGPGFAELEASVRFEELGAGRRGAVLVRPDARGVPIVRTTTAYRAPAQRFAALHERLADDLGGGFNNALIEHYTNAYSTMKRHSDQMLDLAEGSSIAIYSCYRDPARPSRRLVVRSKEPGGAAFDIVLAHGSVVAFSLETNRRFTHTIALVERAPDSDWLGVTVRTSVTFMPAAGLTLATDDERRAFFQLRRRENDEVDFAWPPIGYTISESDLLPVGGDGAGSRTR